MVAIIDDLLIGSSATALITYLFAKVRCFIKNPCTENQLCIYGTNESHLTNIMDDDNEIIIITAKRHKPFC